MRSDLRPRHPLVAGCLIAMLGLMAVSGCSDDGGSGDSSAAAEAEGAAQGGDVNGSFAAANRNAARDMARPQSGRSEGQAPALVERAEIKTASIRLASADIAAVLQDVDALVAARQGLVDSADTQTDRAGRPTEALVVIRVPVDTFDETVSEIIELGRLVRSQTFSEDVTTEVADINARVRNAQRSITQLRGLFSEATRLGDIIRLESELTQRQGELESLQAQQRVLAGQTDMSTISIRVTEPPEKPKPKAQEEDEGFVAGLHQGWDAMKSFFHEASHVAGVMLPLTVVALVIAVAARFVVRRFSWWPRTRTSE